MQTLLPLLLVGIWIPRLGMTFFPKNLLFGVPLGGVLGLTDSSVLGFILELDGLIGFTSSTGWFLRTQ